MFRTNAGRGKRAFYRRCPVARREQARELASPDRQLGKKSTQSSMSQRLAECVKHECFCVEGEELTLEKSLSSNLRASVFFYFLVGALQRYRIYPYLDLQWTGIAMTAPLDNSRDSTAPYVRHKAVIMALF